MILVSGVSGFIGGSLARYLAAQGRAVTGLSRQERPDALRTQYDENEIAALVNELRPQAILHAAGSASVGASISDPAADFAAQVGLFQRVLEGVRRSAHRPRVVFMSSAAVYGNPLQLPVPESAPLTPISPYGHHKVAAELLAREYAECFAVPTLVVRLFSLFGPAQRRLLLWELFDQFRNHPQVTVEGTGDEARDYLYIDDLAETLLRLVTAVNAPTLTVNVASGGCVTVRELAGRIGRILGSEKSIVYRGRSIPGNPTRWQADISLLRRLIDPPHGEFDERLALSLRQWLA